MLICVIFGREDVISLVPGHKCNEIHVSYWSAPFLDARTYVCILKEWAYFSRTLAIIVMKYLCFRSPKLICIILTPEEWAYFSRTLVIIEMKYLCFRSSKLICIIFDWQDGCVCMLEGRALPDFGCNRNKKFVF